MKLTIDTSMFLNERDNPPKTCNECPFVYCKALDMETGKIFTMAALDYYASNSYDDDNYYRKWDHRCLFTHKRLPYGKDKNEYECITIDGRREGCPFDKEVEG